MKRYIIAPEAGEDIKAIKAYLKREAGLSVANSTLKKIRDAFELLRRTPGLGHIREDLTDEPVKFWPVFPYLIVYNPSTQPIEIVRVIHGNRDVSAILLQDD